MPSLGAFAVSLFMVTVASLLSLVVMIGLDVARVLFKRWFAPTLNGHPRSPRVAPSSQR